MNFSTLSLRLFLLSLFMCGFLSIQAQWHDLKTCENPWVLCEQEISLPAIPSRNVSFVPGVSWRPEHIVYPWQNDRPAAISKPQPSSVPDPWKTPVPVSGHTTIGNGFNLNQTGFLPVPFDPAWRSRADAMKPGTSFKWNASDIGLLTFTLMAKVDREPEVADSFELSYLVSWKTEDDHSVKKPLYIVVREQGIHYFTEK